MRVFPDSNQIAILPFTCLTTNLLDKVQSAASLSSSEIYEAGIQLKKCAVANSLTVDEKTCKIQLIPIINKNGEKEVFVKYLCKVNDGDKNWKNCDWIIFGGGSCYFSLWVNLKSKKYHGLFVNSPM